MAYFAPLTDLKVVFMAILLNNEIYKITEKVPDNCLYVSGGKSIEDALKYIKRKQRRM